MKVFGVPLRAARGIVTAVVVLDLLALLAFAFHTTTVVTKTITPASSASSPLPSTAAKPPAPLSPPTGTGVTTVPVSQPLPSSRTATHRSPKVRHHHKATARKKAASPHRPVSGGPAVAKCPAKLKQPAQTGGLKSLISLAPAFGPFSAEAFAAASAYQPELQLIGPILAKYPAIAPKIAPLLNPLLTVWESGLNHVFSLISPYYAPHRKQVLNAETKLATFFAPYSEKLGDSPLAGCAIDLEAALTGDTKSAHSKPRHRAPGAPS